MALKIFRRDNRHLARLVTGKGAPCAFCQREVDDEATYGKLYAIGDIQCHYFCCLLSCCLIQKGHDEEGLFGFMYADIIAEIERCKKHKCSYCGRNGANLGCSVGVCRKQFHLPCGREKNAISLYYGTFKSYCQQHAPKQKIPDHIMAKARLRKKVDRMTVRNVKEPDKTVSQIAAIDLKQDAGMEEMVCVICYEKVDGFPTVLTFWPPCCARDAWFHRSCLQRMALSAGMHYLKCPLCNDKENFYDAVVSQGYYVPDRDAAWELEQNAFAEIYERPLTCCAEECVCPKGREHDSENGKWDIKLCLLCGSAGAHAHCITDQSQKRSTETIDQSDTNNAEHITINQSETTNRENIHCDQSDAANLNQSQIEASDQSRRADFNQSESSESNDQSNACIIYVCRSCLPAAPEDISKLAKSIEAVIHQEQAETNANNSRRPVMPSRMSLRRTKGRLPLLDTSSSSRSRRRMVENEASAMSNTQISRQGLNLKTPRRPNDITRDVFSPVKENDSKFMSPIKLLEQSFKEKVESKGIRDAVLHESVIETLRRKFRKPRPLSAKKRVMNAILDGLFDDLMKDSPKQKEQLEDWCSSKKTYEKDSTELQTSVELATPLVNNDKENDGNSTNTPTKINKNVATFNDNERKDISETTKEYICRYSVSETTEINETETNDKISARDIRINKKYVTETIDDSVIESPSKDIKSKINSVSKTIVNNVETSPKETKSRSNSVYETDHNIITTPKRETRTTRASVSKTTIHNDGETTAKCKEIRNTYKTTVDILTPTKNDSKVINENDITETPLITRNIEYCSNKNVENTSVISGENDAVETPKINIENRNTTDSVSETNKRDEIDISNIENTSMVKLYDSENEFVKKTNVKKKSPKSKRRFTKIKRKYNKLSKSIKSIKTNEQKCIEISNEETKLNEENMRQKYKHCSEDGNILRRLLTEKDLTSKLLSELTRARTETDKIETNKTETDKIETSKTETNKVDTITTETVKAETDKIETNQNETDKIETAKTDIIETPKRKTIDIQQDSSLEISGNDQSINIDVIKNDTMNSDAYKNLIQVPEATKTCSFKFSPLDKETLEKNDLGIDLENFKKEYLNEVDREFKCNFKHKHVENSSEDPKLKTAIDFALDAALKKEQDGDMRERDNRKRRMSETGIKLVFANDAKKRKSSESNLKLTYNKDDSQTNDVNDGTKSDVEKHRSNRKIRGKCKDKRKFKKKRSTRDKNIKVTIDSSEKRGKNKKIKKKIKTKFAIRNENFHVKIKWKTKQLSLNIESKKNNKKEKKEIHSKLQQYVLQFPDGASKEVIAKPEKAVCPLKKKRYIKLEKSPDKLKQMSIHNFFMIKSPEK